ncbi:MAG TPA: nitrous oxide reductase accessory protein NosL [Thiobacillus sp.]|jgi:nitrous oxide reductase accessory protein NosL|nr:nitrous oxide reductase accessory protein NosL [Thiobacillus sp.]
MRLPGKRLSLGIAVLAIAVAAAAVVLLSHDERAVTDPDLVTNELCIVAPATPYDPASGLAMFAPRPIPVAARCPVCGMYPARFPRWAAQSIFRDGAAHYFDSPIDLFVFLQKVDRYDIRYALNEVAISFVTDFDTGQWIEAQDAFFVHGSSAFGPMRDADLPAFASREAADALTRSRGGRVLAFTEVTPELIQSLNRSVHHRH